MLPLHSNPHSSFGDPYNPFSTPQMHHIPPGNASILGQSSPPAPAEETLLHPLLETVSQIFGACKSCFENVVNGFSPVSLLAVVHPQPHNFLPALTNRQITTYSAESENGSTKILSNSPGLPAKKALYPLVYAAYFGIFDEAFAETMKINTQIPWYTVNRINIAFVTLDHEGNLTLPDAQTGANIRSLVAMARQSNPETEIFVVSNYDGDMDQRYLRAAENPNKFAASVLKFLRDYDLDGYDMDWETPSINAYQEALHDLLKACYNLFQSLPANERQHKVTHAVWPVVHAPSTVGLLAESVDGINIMSYGMDIEALKALLAGYAEAGFPYEKMIVGRESESESETKESIFRIVEFIKGHNLGGGFFWRFDNDSRKLADLPSSRIGPSTFQRSKWFFEAIDQIYGADEKHKKD